MTFGTVAHQAPLFMGFSRQEYWSGFLCPFPENLPNSGIKPVSLMSPTLAGRLFTSEFNGEKTISLTSGAGENGQPLVKE